MADNCMDPLMDDIYLQRCGGISPVKATAEMTQPVGQRNGKLFTEPGGAGNVESVNGKTGTVILTGEDIAYDNGISVNDAIDTKANAASLAHVATSGSYNDLINKPIIPVITGKVDKSAPADNGTGTFYQDNDGIGMRYDNDGDDIYINQSDNGTEMVVNNAHIYLNVDGTIEIESDSADTTIDGQIKENQGYLTIGGDTYEIHITNVDSGTAGALTFVIES